ncbi:MAG: hypothetical protein ABEJ70_01620 [Halobacteriaceae archaeon]
MSQSSNPMAAAFDVQRRFIRQSQQFYEQGLEASLAATDTVHRYMDATKSAQKQGAALTRSSMMAAIDVAAASTPTDAAGFESLRAAIDSSFEDFDAAHEEAWTAYEQAVDEGLDAYEELSDAQRQMVADVVEAAMDASEQFESEAERAADVARQTVDEA